MATWADTISQHFMNALSAYTRVWIAFPALLALAACWAGGTTETRFYNVSINFTYAGHTYHETWVHECIAYHGDEKMVQWTQAPAELSINSRWLGFAKRLPDGSAVLFKFRQDICGNQ